jgi:TolB protein
VNFARYPAWSPDGAQIAYQTTRAGFPQIWVMDAQGNEAREFSNPNKGRSLMPVWAPDMSLLLFVQGGSPTFLVSRQLDNQQAVEVRVSDTFFPAENPSISPDGWWIAANSTVDKNLDIYILSRSGSSLTRLTDDPAADFDPDWD